MKTFFDKYGEFLAGILAIAAIAAVAGACYDTGHKSASNHYKALMAEADKMHAEVYAKLEAKYRKQEQDHAAAIAAIDKTHTERLKNVQAKNRADLAVLRNGALQLHNRFICPDAGSTVPATGTSPGLGNGTSGGGLRIADAEFLVSEADRADGAVIQLQACQAIILADIQAAP